MWLQTTRYIRFKEGIKNVLTMSSPPESKKKERTKISMLLQPLLNVKHKNIAVDKREWLGKKGRGQDCLARQGLKPLEYPVTGSDGCGQLPVGVWLTVRIVVQHALRCATNLNEVLLYHQKIKIKRQWTSLRLSNMKRYCPAILSKPLLQQKNH